MTIGAYNCGCFDCIPQLRVVTAAAAAYETGTPNPGRAHGHVPALRYDNRFGGGGKNIVRFDGIEGQTLIDRKLSFFASEDAKNALVRQSAAIKQNPEGMKGDRRAC